MIDINLIAARRGQRQRALALMRLAFYGLFGMATLIVLLYAWLTVQISLVSGRIAEAEAVLSSPQMRGDLRHIRYLEGQIAELAPKAQVLKRVHESESRWITVLRDTGNSIPAQVWVASFSSRSADKGQQLTFSGAAFSQRLIGAYMLALQRATWCGPLQLVKADANRDPRKEGIVDFEVTVPLREPIGIGLLGQPEKAAPKAPAPTQTGENS